ncbi:MAG TPA: peptidoglycan DD-metalloendopeptidase family protein [Anaerolineaceae bacterium]|nr:peptidoglycan DD-metalloendopeptidase family protein [Anaerolineaceae bacterium]
MRSKPPLQEKTAKPASLLDSILPKISWGVAGAMVVLMLFVAIEQPSAVFSFPGDQKNQAAPFTPTLSASDPAAINLDQLPEFAFQPLGFSGLKREINVHTSIPDRPREDVQVYTVAAGDSLFAIAKDYNIKPETILWANYDVLRDNPDTLSIGMRLQIPPTNGILYRWKEGDRLEEIAAKFKASVAEILGWPGNRLDMANPVIPKDTLVMIPNGSREFVTWFVPTIPRGKAGVNKNIAGPGSCDTGQGGLIGSGNFRWPTNGSHVLSGNDYWSGHLGIDIAADLGTPILASDSGVIVYAGAISGGYGNMVMIDHGNGWQTLYAHLSRIAAYCGGSVAQGNVIGYAGSTGNSTGPHLHFEVRYMGGFVNPWSVVH